MKKMMKQNDQEGVYPWNKQKIRNILYNLLQEKKDETCFEEQVMTIQDSLQ